MELLTYKIARKTGDHKPVVIAPLGDLQYTGKRGTTALDMLKRHIDRCLGMDAVFIGMGDYTDFASPSNRQRIRGAALYETAEEVMEDAALNLADELYEQVLQPTTGKWIGLLQGHHWFPLMSGGTTDTHLCKLLKTRFLGTTAYVRIQFQITATQNNNVVLWASHGCGNGTKSSYPVTKLEAVSNYWDADIFLMGHASKMALAPLNRVSPRFDGVGAPDLVHKKIYLVGTGGFSKAYVEGKTIGGYVEQAMLTPAALGAPIIKVTQWTRNSTHNGKRVASWSPEISVEM